MLGVFGTESFRDKRHHRLALPEGHVIVEWWLLRPVLLSRAFPGEGDDLLRCAADGCCICPQIHRNLHRDKEVASENIVIKVIERRWRMQLTGGDPSIRIGPVPAGRRDAL